MGSSGALTKHVTTTQHGEDDEYRCIMQGRGIGYGGLAWLALRPITALPSPDLWGKL